MVIFDVVPFRSVMVLSGNGADVAKHCVPAVPSKRYLLVFLSMPSLDDEYIQHAVV